ncbi:hypothetical protein M422DRAFT_268981 [Sphaerobolus stellatus SS14]|uniref:Unplaced genomic scaffold SPHSTscaffold_204, whole genome shotgun sequence n=1 Tax=Sphaerobolus stellatus (strain SS14) TaxID=990650 RepID=A0A0C9ULD6_SPHS4|nr:hypothetical protein M422DRAFT_268981 [Sphaerobolus stellatus SS14]
MHAKENYGRLWTRLENVTISQTSSQRTTPVYRHRYCYLPSTVRLRAARRKADRTKAMPSSGTTLKVYLQNKIRRMCKMSRSKRTSTQRNLKPLRIAQKSRKPRSKPYGSATISTDSRRSGYPEVERDTIPSPYVIKRRPLPSFTPIPETPSPSRPPALTPLYVSPPRTPCKGNWRTSSVLRERHNRLAAQAVTVQPSKAGSDSNILGNNSPIIQEDKARSSQLSTHEVSGVSIENELYQSINNPSRSPSCDRFTGLDFALARAAQKLVEKRKEIQDYRMSVQCHMNNLTDELEEIEEDIFQELLKTAVPQQKQCLKDGYGQFSDPQGLLYKSLSSD